ncbi:hypothetical protein Nham_4409 (plasmid) [Nitrobacter hamburgensis X14]|uniref:Uncharacterized protein n=1 Tax=Nitrobacter hamburgensis (strain DSM 10229 / NCIMB 13809 / X14) TaxID=323097 RepID=Q1QFK4_NITHX|nr:hypothetical protein Nham_4409 [Nitrobacter hamburgensis X14]
MAPDRLRHRRKLLIRRQSGGGLNAGVDAKSAGNDTVPSDLPTSFLSRNFRLRGEEFNRAHIVVTCNRRSFVSEFIHVRSI